MVEKIAMVISDLLSDESCPVPRPMKRPRAELGSLAVIFSALLSGCVGLSHYTVPPPAAPIDVSVCNVAAHHEKTEYYSFFPQYFRGFQVVGSISAASGCDVFVDYAGSGGVFASYKFNLISARSRRHLDSFVVSMPYMPGDNRRAFLQGVYDRLSGNSPIYQQIIAERDGAAPGSGSEKDSNPAGKKSQASDSDQPKSEGPQWWQQK